MHPSLKLFGPDTGKWFEEAIGSPTPVQEDAWPVIAAGGHALVSAPTGTGKTLSAFLVYIDRMKALSKAGTLNKELYLIYISPLKSLAGDIRENLHRPLFGIRDVESGRGEYSVDDISVSVRTGDTSASERKKMVKNPPHILITTPESLYLLITSQTGRNMLKTARAVIVDELHAMIETKRGAHLMLTLERLDALCGAPLQRVGLSATIEPLDVAAKYLAGSGINVSIAAPKMIKNVRIEVTAPIENMRQLPQGTIWPELARAVYEQCYGARSVIAFVDGRMYAERLAYHVNQLAGPDFAYTHHGSVSKEQRREAEDALRAGTLRLLVATSSMELGIDVGDIDRVVQIAYPRSISSLLQRLGRAGHNPGRTSVMHLFPRTPAEGLYCGLTASVATDGGIERLKPPRLCFDVIAQHLVSMAVGNGYSVDEAHAVITGAYPFRDVTVEDIKLILRMLAGDYEHAKDIPVRPRILYDRINERVEGDSYSRMLAVSAGGTIPDTGQFTVKTEGGVKIGELDEEFVFEQRVGYKFMLGSFAWRITQMDRDTVFVAQTNPEGAEPPFWRNAWLARKLQTALAFGQKLRAITEAAGEADGIFRALKRLGLDEAMANNTAGVIERQLAATEILPDHENIIAEHFSDEAGDHQLMLHSIFGRQVNAPLSILMQEAAGRLTGNDASVYEDDDGILLMARGGRPLPEGILQTIQPSTAQGILEATLPGTPLFNMTFRYNAGRALMMGTKNGKRNPLWVQRLRAAELLDAVVRKIEHPLIRETRRECAEDYWDLPGLMTVLGKIKTGEIKVRELRRKEASPFSLPLRRAAESNLLYEYHPSTKNIGAAAAEALDEMLKIKPAAEQLAKAALRKKLPADERQLHSLLMMEGDIIAGELDVPLEWFELLAAQGRAMYVEPGLWIAAEHFETYSAAQGGDWINPSITIEDEGGGSPAEPNAEATFCARREIFRRLLRYKGAHDVCSAAERYCVSFSESEIVLEALVASGEAVKDGEAYYHADLYEFARNETIRARRRQIQTRPPEAYAALLAGKIGSRGQPAEALNEALRSLAGRAFAPALWENALLPARVSGYRPALLDALLSSGEWVWAIGCEGGASALSFREGSDVDYEFDISDYSQSLEGDEKAVYDSLLKRGASFPSSLPPTASGAPVYDILVSLMEKGLVCADSFVPVRQWQDRDKLKSRTPKQRVGAKVSAIVSGRWDLSRPTKPSGISGALDRVFAQLTVVSRETAAAFGVSWQQALEKLRVLEYTGRARRGYFVEELSGAQFIKEEDYAAAILTLERPADDFVWAAAPDPLQAWGRLLAQREGASFMCVPGTAVCLRAGVPVAVFERYAQALRVFDGNGLVKALKLFLEDYAKKRIFPDKRRIAVKNYPPEAAEALEEAGFIKTMMDYSAYQ